jgi:signal transduction histidine kinase
MIPRSLGGRLATAFAVLALAIVVAVGGTLFLVLRGLHADATLGSLADVAGSVLPQVRTSVGSGDLRGTIAEISDQLAARDIEVMLVDSGGQVRPLAGTTTGQTIDIGSTAIGDSVRGRLSIDGRPYLYVAVVVRRAGAAILPRAVAFMAPDRSFALALADVGRTIPAVLLVILAIGAPLALVVSRSVTRPLGRVAGAAAAVPSGGAHSLPLEGPAEVRELTDAFNAMSAELAATRQRERELLADLRHDLRTPLTVIGGFAAALSDGTATGPAAADAARAIEEEAARLERLVDELGAVERIRTGEDGLRPETVDGRQLAADAVSRFAARAAAAGVEIARDEATGRSGDEPLTLTADRLAVERMLGNLMGNALAAAGSAPGGGPRQGSSGAPGSRDGTVGWVRVDVLPARLPDGREAVRFDVLDDGPGFPPGHAGRAFERFWRGDPSRTGQGSGLGLAIVRELALAHGGTVHAENLAPRGARVGFTLPRTPGLAAGVAAPIASRSVPA